jgi:hypothetical protein
MRYSCNRRSKRSSSINSILKKITMKKSGLFLLQLFAAAGLFAQLNVPPTTQTNGSFSIYSPGTVTTGNPTSVTVGTSPSSGYEYISSQSIHFPSAFHAGANAGSIGKFNARLVNNDLPAAILYPAPDNLNAVPKFSKVEFGVDLSSIPGLNFDTRVNAFLNDFTGPNSQVDYKPGTPPYDQAYWNKVILNPYDPDHISIDAVFFRPGSPNQNPIIRHGFYYKEFSRTGLPYGWTQVSTDWEWRIRFAPDEIGAWTGFINVWVDGVLLPQSISFSFTVTTSSNPGYVSVDNSNHHYLKFTGDGSTYFPVGDVYYWTNQTWGYNWGLRNQLLPYGNSTDGSRMFYTTNSEMTNYLQKLTGWATGGGGGNATRIGFTTWGFMVEREKLNNYDTRQIEMWELDDVMDLLEEYGVYSVLVIGNSGQLHWDNPGLDNNEQNFSDHWDGHPYCDQTITNPYSNVSDNFYFKQCKGIAGIDDPRKFFTDPVCKDFYKKQLRYIVARWGYSTAISMWELLNEADNSGVTGTGALPFQNDALYAQDVANWHDEMFAYMRNSLQDPHLRTTSLLGIDYHTSTGNNGLLLWNKPNIDVITGHNYFSDENGLRFEAANFLPSALALNKPVFTGEGDPWDFIQSECATDWDNHNRHWSCLMSGKCASGLNWSNFRYTNSSWNYNTNSPIEVTYEGEYERNYKAVRTFVEMIDFQNYLYIPGICTANVSGQAGPFETFYLRNTNYENVYGWTHNRSFNRFTVNTFLNPFDYDSNPSTAPCTTATQVRNANPPWEDAVTWQNSDPINPANSVYNMDNYVLWFGVNNYNPVYFPSYSIFVENLDQTGEYKVDWYWTWGSNGGQFAGYSSNTVSNPLTTYMVGSRLYFQTPPTGNSGSIEYPGDWAFVVTKMNPRLAQSISAANLFVEAHPNPSAGVFTINSAPSTSPAKIEVHTLDGRLVLQTETNMLNGYQLDLTNEAEGVYVLTVRCNDQLFTTRLIKIAQ